MHKKSFCSFLFFVLLFILYSCSPQQEKQITEVVDTINNEETNSAEATYVDMFAMNHEKWENYQPQPIDSITFYKAYRNKQEMNFKGVEDFDKMVMVSYDWGDTLMRDENTHEIYISNFSRKGFDFSLAAYATDANPEITSSCHINEKAVFSSYNIAIHGKNEDDENYYEDEQDFRLMFYFYDDTLLIEPSGCHSCYCGAACEMGRVFVLQKEEDL